MEQISGLSNWRLVVKREQDHIEILRAVTCDKKAILPDELWGLPVTILGDHSLAYNATPVTFGTEATVPGVAVGGEILNEICQVQITCGSEGQWDNRQLEELTFPEQLTEVRDYALYGCRDLKTLRFHDRVNRWGGGSLMNCGRLDTFYVTRVGERQGEALAFLCDEIHRELFVTVREPDGEDGAKEREYKLIFPEYVEEFEENCPAHHFDYTIYGGGHPYHHVFKAKQLILRDYDGLWDKMLREDYSPEGAMRLAWTRLRWPVELSEKAENQYWKYLKERKESALMYQLSQKDTQGLKLMLEGLEPEDDLFHRVCEQARRDHNTEALAVLLERQQKEEATGFDKDFDL